MTTTVPGAAVKLIYCPIESEHKRSVAILDTVYTPIRGAEQS